MDSQDIVIPSERPDSWKLKELFIQGVFLGGYQALMTVVFYYIIHRTDFFQRKFGVRTCKLQSFIKLVVGSLDKLDSLAFVSLCNAEKV